jgi:hypothetical protein
MTTSGTGRGLRPARNRCSLSRPSRDRAVVGAHAGVDEGWLVTRALPILTRRWDAIDAGLVPCRRRQDAIPARGEVRMSAAAEARPGVP